MNENKYWKYLCDECGSKFITEGKCLPLAQAWKDRELGSEIPFKHCNCDNCNTVANCFLYPQKYEGLPEKEAFQIPYKAEVQQCSNCKFGIKGVDYLECHRHAPIVNPDPLRNHLFPAVHRADYCGDYEIQIPDSGLKEVEMPLLPYKSVQSADKNQPN